MKGNRKLTVILVAMLALYLPILQFSFMNINLASAYGSALIAIYVTYSAAIGFCLKYFFDKNIEEHKVDKGV
jgi:hypothetical protein